MSDKNKKTKYGFLNPVRWPFFYGWVVVFFGTLGMLMSAPGQTIGVSAFTNHLIDAMDISRVNLSLAYLFGTIASASLLSTAGRVYDRWGARVTGPLASLGLGLVLIALSQIDHLTQFLGGLLRFLPHSWLAFAMLALAFLGIRFFGQGLTTLVARNMLMKWFVRRRGLVNGIRGAFVAFGFSSAPKLFDMMIESSSWRYAWLGMGLFIGILFSLLALLFYRDNPQQFGLEPDGGMAGPQHAKMRKAQPDIDYDLPQARRCYSFWVFLGGMALFALYNTAMAFHIVSIFGAADMSKDQATMIFIPGAIIAVTGNIIFSWLSDYIKLKYLLYVLLGGIALSTGSMFFLRDGMPVITLIIGNGVMAAVFGLLLSVTWPRFFGVTHLGAISGYALGFVVAASAVGPYLFSLSNSLTGGYGAGALSCFLAAALLLAGALRADNPSE